MTFYKKHRQTIVRTAIYTFMTLTVIVTVALLMLVVLGYSYNKKDGRLEQGGLLQFQSTPTAATITLDEAKFGSPTNSRTTVDVGTHTVSYNKQDYRTWNKTISIDAGEIGWLNYARLIPNTIKPATQRTFTTLSDSLASPQQNYMLLHEAADSPSFTLANIQGDTVRYSTLTLPGDSFTAPSAGKTQTFTLDSWSYNEQAVLIRHTYDDDKTEWLLLDRDSPDKSIDVTTTFGVTPSKLQFAGKGDRLLFVQTDDIVRRINLDDQTLSRPLASKVDTFTGYDDKTIAFSTVVDDNSQRSVGYAAVDISQPQTIATFSADNQPLMAAMATYFGRRYVIIVHGDQLTVQYGTLPTSNSPAQLKTDKTVTIPAGTSNLMMSHNSRFAIMQTPTGYATYDIELAKFDATDWAHQTTTPESLHWLDEYLLWSDYGNELRFYDFDGANQQNIMPVAEGYDASISPSGKYVYGINKTDKGYEFERAQLILQ